jgi:hypothetical protein
MYSDTIRRIKAERDMFRTEANLISSSLRASGALNLIRLSETFFLVIKGTYLVQVYLYTPALIACQAGDRAALRT